MSLEWWIVVTGLLFWLLISRLSRHQPERAVEWLSAILTKSPHDGGPWLSRRIGPLEWQDWWRSIGKMARIIRVKCIPDNDVLLIGAFQATDNAAEVDIYQEVFRHRLGRPVFLPRVFRRGLETTVQVDIAFGVALQEGKGIVFLATWLHYLRVLWIIRRHPDSRTVPWELYGAFGIPRPKEAITDVFLTVGYPVLDLLGLKQWFVDLTDVRRAQGKH